MGAAVKLCPFLCLLHYSREGLVGRETGYCQIPSNTGNSKRLDLLSFRKSQQYDCKWYIPLTDLSFQMVDESEAVPNIPLVPDEELDAMKIKISQIKNDIQREKVKRVEHSIPSTDSVPLLRWGADRISIPRATERGQTDCSAEACGAALLAVSPLLLILVHGLNDGVLWGGGIKKTFVVPSSSSTCVEPPVSAILEHLCGRWGSYAVDMRTGSVSCYSWLLNYDPASDFSQKPRTNFCRLRLLKLFLTSLVSKHQQIYGDYQLRWLCSLTQI